ncbi:hypothetical protein D9M69_421770 [compost metagenome]
MAGRRRGRAAAQVLARPAWRCPAHPRTAHRPPAPCAAEPARRQPRLRHSSAAGRSAGATGAGPAGHAVHAAAGGLQPAAAALQPPGRPLCRRAGRQPPARRVRGADRPVRQHPGAAHAHRYAPVLHCTAATGTGNRAGRPGAPGPAVRTTGGSPAAGTQPQPQPAVPGAVQPAAARGGVARATAGAEPAEPRRQPRQRAGRPRPVRRPARRRPPRLHLQLRQRPVRRRQHPAHGRAFPQSAAGFGCRADACCGRAGAARRRGTRRATGSRRRSWWR